MKLEPCPFVPIRRTMGKPDDIKYAISETRYAESIRGCFLGKNIGGTAGAPMEWQRQTNEFTDYIQRLNGEPYPNDDLDLQLLSLLALEENGLSLTPEALCQYWIDFLTPNWAEYGDAKTNMRRGLLPPLSGSWLNEHKNSNGAFVRSEIWAAICPGAPALAVRYAYNDAILDHGDGEGMYAMLFVAAIESAAFVVGDVGTLLEIGLSYIPKDCLVAKAVRFTVFEHSAGTPWRELRDPILDKFRGSANNANPEMGDVNELARGYMDGELGMDAPSSMAFLAAGLLYCAGDVGELLKIVIYFGDDTDCTAATGCAILGISGGTRAMPDKWASPIGDSIKTMCLNIGDLGEGGRDIPSTVGALAKRIARLGKRVGLSYARGLDVVSHSEENLPPAKELYANGGDEYTELSQGSVFHGAAFDAQLIIEGGPFIKSGEEKRITLKLENHARSPQTVEIRVWCDEPLVVRAGQRGAVTLKTPYMHGETRRGVSQSADITVACESLTAVPMRGVIQINAACSPIVLNVPFTLLNGDMETLNPDTTYRFSAKGAIL